MYTINEKSRALDVPKLQEPSKLNYFPWTILVLFRSDKSSESLL